MNQKYGILGILCGFLGLLLAISKYLMVFGTATLQILLILVIVVSIIAFAGGLMSLLMQKSNLQDKKIGIASILLSVASLTMFLMVEAGTATPPALKDGPWIGVWVNDDNPSVKLSLNAGGMFRYEYENSVNLGRFTVNEGQMSLVSGGGPGLPTIWKIVKVDDKSLVLKIEEKDTPFHKE